MPRRARRGGLFATAVVIAAAAAAAAVVLHVARAGAGCLASAFDQTARLDLDQAGNAATIAAVGLRRGLPNHAVTVALATALQESKLHNLPYGDRDSVGLFQQRPSQGWGTPQQLRDPRYAAGAFYDHLAKVRGWQELSVTEAAQRVQRSGAPNAYARWEQRARTLAIALTGEVAAGLRCRVGSKHSSPGEPLGRAVALELGPGALTQALQARRGWAVACWLVAHAAAYRIALVSFANRTWSTRTATWRTGGPADGRVRMQLAGTS